MEKKEMKGGVFNECLLMNIFLTGCPHGQGEGGREVSQMQTAVGRGRGGSQKSLKMCGHPLWMAPSDNSSLDIISFLNVPPEAFLSKNL